MSDEEAPSAVAPHVPPSERAMRLFRESIVLDLHNDMPSRALGGRYDPSVRQRPGRCHTDLPRLAEAGVTAIFFIAWVDARLTRTTPDGSFARALRLLDWTRAFAARHPGTLRVALSAGDVRAAKREGRVAALLAVEGGHAIEGSLDNLRTLYERGARYLTLTWNNGNEWAGSSIGDWGTRRGGLTPFGAEVVREMNRLGMIVDVSHVSSETLRDVLAVSAAPVFATHSNARALHEHPRNLTDDELRAIAAAGGVVGVNFFPEFLDPRHRERATPIDVLVDHIEHIARVVGTPHVALGSDFDGIPRSVEGLDDITAFPNLVQALLDRGFNETDVRGILGENALRVMEQVVG